MKSETFNFTQYKPGSKKGHYESYFLRANHPSLPLAFWFRYTIFCPKKHPEKALAELWAIWFDGQKKQHVAAKKEIPLQQAVFASDKFYVAIEDACLTENMLSGKIINRNVEIEWQLNYVGAEKPLLVLHEKLYESPFPKAKLLVGKPLALFNGNIKVNQTVYHIENWVGSQNHNWGVKHTDHYAWGQVAGFDNAPHSFFEVATARLKFGPLWTPFMTVMVLRHNNQEYRLNTILHALKAHASFNYFNWHFDSAGHSIRINGTITALKDDFVGLKYYNPPGGIKHCLNSKIASCKICITHKNAQGKIHEEILETSSRAAFEILTDDHSHGVSIIV
jgi:hypothetical protein